MAILSGKSALVTGAGRGIGRAIAMALASAGANVVVNDSGAGVQGQREAVGALVPPADAVVAEIKAAGGSAAANYGSVADAADAAGMVDQVVREFGRIDVLVNVAGILRDNSIVDMTEDEWDAVVAVHLKGTFNTVRPAARLMQLQRSGRIINTGSVSSYGATGQSNYAAAKAGISGLSGSLALELAEFNVTTNTILPRADTRLVDSMPIGREMFAKTGRWPSEASKGAELDPMHIGPLVVYLASDAAQHVNGQTFRAFGNTYILIEHPRIARAISKKDANEVWDVNDLDRLFSSVFGNEFSLPPEDIGPGLRDTLNWNDITDADIAWKLA